MAKLKGVFKIKGKFGNGTAYNTKNGNIYRTNAQNTKERYKDAPENGRLKQNNREFANCVACARLVYNSFGVLTSGFQSRAWGKLVSNLTKMLDYSILPRGERVPATVNYLPKKINFFPASRAVSRAIRYSPITFMAISGLGVVRVSGSFHASLFKKKQVGSLTGLYYFVNFYVCMFNFETNTFTNTLAYSSGYLPVSITPVPISFDVSTTSAGNFGYIITEFGVSPTSTVGIVTTYYDVYSMGVL